MKFLFMFCIGFFISGTSYTQEFDVFYLSVGSAHYLQDKSKIKEGCEPFQNINGARRSARYIHEILSQKTNGEGIMLRSQSDSLLSKDAILNALDHVITMANKAKAKKPFTCFLFLRPWRVRRNWLEPIFSPWRFCRKTSKYSFRIFSNKYNELSEKLLHLGEITDLLESANMPYMCLIDACYEGKQEHFSNLDTILSKKAIQSLHDTAKILRFMNEYHSENPVVFATPPGTATALINDPFLAEGIFIGPLCRKMLLVEKQLETLETLTLMDIMLLLTDTTFDKATPNVISNFKAENNAFNILLKVN